MVKNQRLTTRFRSYIDRIYKSHEKKFERL